MAQLTNKCSDEDIEYYIRECGDILGVTQTVENPDDPKAILHYIFQEIIKYKCSNLSWSGSYNDAYSHARGGDRSRNDSNEATQNGATDNSNSDIPQLDAIWSVQLALHLTEGIDSDRPDHGPYPSIHNIATISPCACPYVLSFLSNFIRLTSKQNNCFP